MTWSTLAWSPTATRHAALLMLFQLLVGVAIGVLAVAGLTIISISTARASARAPEVSLRRALGAARRHLFASTLIEGGIIAGAALLVGGMAGTVAGRSALATWSGGVGATTRAASIGAALALLAGLLLGAVLPLMFQRRASPLPRAGGKPLQLAVPALQLGLSLTALTAAALLRQQATPLIPRGAAQLMHGAVFQVTAPEAPPGVRAERYAQVLKQLRARRPAEPVSLSSPGALVGLGMVDVVITDCGRCAQGGLPLPLHPVPATHYLVSSDTFRVLGLQVVAGRVFSARDRWHTARVAVVNQSLALRHFEQGQAVGRKILVERERAEWYTVVGVVENQRPVGFGAGLQPPFAVYLSVLQHPARSVDLFVQAPGGAGAGSDADDVLRRTLGAAATPVAPASASRLLAVEAAPLRWFGGMFEMEGWVILAIATLGTFVVMRLWVASVWYELGLRRAVGARRRDIFGFVLLRAAGVAASGVAIGLWLGLFLWGGLATIVAGLPAWDVHTALHVAPVLVGATLAGALMPAWQAARAAPTELIGAAV
jgi:putative ABC transport system permease protein